MSAKHKTVRVRTGLYNYRGYCIYRVASGFMVRDEDGKPLHLERRLRDMRAILDGDERRNFAPHWHPTTPPARPDGEGGA